MAKMTWTATLAVFILTTLSMVKPLEARPSPSEIRAIAANLAIFSKEALDVYNQTHTEIYPDISYHIEDGPAGELTQLFSRLGEALADVETIYYQVYPCECPEHVPEQACHHGKRIRRQPNNTGYCDRMNPVLSQVLSKANSLHHHLNNIIMKTTNRPFPTSETTAESFPTFDSIKRAKRTMATFQRTASIAKQLPGVLDL